MCCPSYFRLRGFKHQGVNSAESPVSTLVPSLRMDRQCDTVDRSERRVGANDVDLILDTRVHMRELDEDRHELLRNRGC